jgi:tetratricopeptide (TPR) repeat protein
MASTDRRVAAGALALLLAVGDAAAQAPDDPCRAAVELYRQGRADESVARFRECVSAVPASAGLLSDYGAALAASGAFDEALVQYARALELLPGHPVIRRNMGLAYYKSGRPGDAAPIFADLLRADPSDARALLLLADCHVQLGEPAKAVDVLAPHEAARSGDPAFAYVFGLALMNAGQVERAGRVIDPLLRDPGSAEAQMLLGSAALARGDLPAAVAAFGKAAALAPALPMVHSLHGQTLLGTGDADGAAAAFRRELAANPNDFEANLRLGQILAARSDPEAEPLLARAGLLRPSSPEPVLDLARIHAKQGDLERARAALESLVRSQPQLAPARRELAAVYARLGRSADAAREDGEARRLGAASADDGGLIAGGAPAPAFDLPRVGAPGRISSAGLWADRPAVLVFGSLSCPKFRFDARALQAIADRYADRAAFVMIYVHEAHGDDSWQSTINERERIPVTRVVTLDDKTHNATLCLRTLSMRLPAVVDGLDRAIERAYAAWPSAVYVIDRGGTVRWRSRLGEQEFSEDAMREALERAIGH